MPKRKQPRCKHLRLVNGKQFILIDPGKSKTLLDEYGNKFQLALVCLDCYGVWI